MHKIAFVFSGQGAQYSGMGKELYNCSDAAKRVFDRFEELRPGTTEQCFTDSIENLSQTVNAQPCLFAVSLAAAECLNDAGVTPFAVAGFSLGEVSALTYAGAFSYEDGFKLVCKRAEFMQDAAEKDEGVMTAVLRIGAEKVEEISKQFKNIYPVNYNCPGQTVVAGNKVSMQDFNTAVNNAGGRVMPLKVSGAFHSPFMNVASGQFLKTLNNFNVFDLKLPVYANNTALPYPSDIRSALAMQMKSPVLWQKTIENMHKNGIDLFIELGAGKTLCGLISKIIPDVKTLNIEDSESFEKTISFLKENGDA